MGGHLFIWSARKDTKKDYIYLIRKLKRKPKNEKKDLHDWMIICSGLPLKGNRQECVGRN